MNTKTGSNRTVWLCLVLLALAQPAFGQATFMNGVDSNYYLDFVENQGLEYRYDGQLISDYFGLLAGLGVDTARIRLFANTSGESNIDRAVEISHLARAANMRIYLVIFLSDRFAALGNQPASARWAGLPLEQMVLQIRSYCTGVAQRFADEGIPVAVYAIGNEIDFGISGFFPEDPAQAAADRDNSFWDEEAAIVKAGQAGVKAVVPGAKFLHHLAWLYDLDFVRGNFQYMIDHDVQIDYLGLSFYANGLSFLADPLTTFQTFAQDLHADFDRQVMVAEYAYPAEPVTDGIFYPAFAHPVVGYPPTLEGQVDYITDFLTWAKTSGIVAGAFYWSPELTAPPLPDWRFMALFDSTTEHDARPGLDALGAGACSSNDADCDAVADEDDCAPVDAGIWATPGAVSNLLATGQDSFSWSPPFAPGGREVRYDLLRTADATDFITDAVCVEWDDGADTEAVDESIPELPGARFFYLVRAENDCPLGLGSLGGDSLGTPRVGRDCP